MRLIHVVRPSCKSHSGSYRTSSALCEVAQAKYPPIVDVSKESVKDRAQQDWYDSIKKVPTVQEKLLGINLPKYYGYRSHMFRDSDAQLGRVNLVKFLTRSNLIHGWPNDVNEKCVEYLPFFKERVQEVLELDAFKDLKTKKFDQSGTAAEKKLGRVLIHALNRALILTLNQDFPHVAKYQVDFTPRVEAFWFSAGVPPSNHIQSFRRGLQKQEESQVMKPVTVPLQYLSHPSLQLRSDLPLPAFVDADHPSAVQGVPIDERWRCPFTQNCSIMNRHGTNIAGVWPGSAFTYCPVTFTTRTWMSRLQQSCFTPLNDRDRQQALDEHGCLSGFSATLSQAALNGFSPFTPLAYPICTTSVITNGLEWSFYAYQLNTICALHQLPEEGSPANICWASKPMSLFLDDSQDGSGLNDEVLLKLLDTYVRQPSSLGDVNLQPYLDADRSVESIESDWLRETYMKNFFHVMSNRPRDRRKPEVYMWERIYKVQFQTRPSDPRKRFFEQKIDPNKRRIDDYVPPYVPKARQPEYWPLRRRSSVRYEKNVYHEMARLRGMRNDDPVKLQELDRLNAWRKQS